MTHRQYVFRTSWFVAQSCVNFMEGCQEQDLALVARMPIPCSRRLGPCERNLQEPGSLPTRCRVAASVRPELQVVARVGRLRPQPPTCVPGCISTRSGFTLWLCDASVDECMQACPRLMKTHTQYLCRTCSFVAQAV